MSNRSMLAPPRGIRRILVLPLAVVAMMAMMANTGIAHASALPTSSSVSGQSLSGAGMLATFNDPRASHLTATEQQQAANKNASARTWQAAAGKRQIIQPDCIIPPGASECDFPVNIGGQYIAEPADETNWCGPGAATAAYLHWNANAVNNHAAITVTNNAGGQSTYVNGQAWMAWFAVVMPVDGRSGVMNRPYSNGTDATVLRDGLNLVTGTSYYVYYNPPNEADMMANVEADIGRDGHPMVYLANTNHLQTWNPGLNINHYVEGYGYDITAFQTAAYADTAPHTSQGNIPGDYWISQDQMWQAVSTAYWVDSNGVHHLISVIVM